MNPTPLADLSPALSLHLWAALAATLLGPLAIYRRRRDRLHRVTGYAWVLTMASLAVSSFWLPAVVLHVFAGFGIIHLLSVWVLLQLTLAVREARLGWIAAHRVRMASLYWQALTVAGLFTLLPGRRLNAVLFGQDPMAGLWVIGGFGLGLLALNLRLSVHVPPVPDGRE